MLATTTAGTLVAEKTYTFTVLSTDSLETVLGKLCVHDLLSLPVQDPKTHQLMGMVSIIDLLIFIAWGPYFESGEFNEEKVTTLRQLERPVSQVLGLTVESRSLFVVEPEMPLTTLLKPFSSGLHRVLVPQKDDFGRTAHRVLSQSDVVSYIYKHRNEVKDLFSKKLSELGITPKSVVAISSSSSALDGFKNMTCEKVPAVAIVDDKGKLVGNLSASDLRGMSSKRLKEAINPVLEFLSSNNGFVRKPVTISLDDTLETAYHRVVNEGLHRLWVVDSQEKPVGCLSLTNLIHVFMPTPQIHE